MITKSIISFAFLLRLLLCLLLCHFQSGRERGGETAEEKKKKGSGKERTITSLVCRSVLMKIGEREGDRDADEREKNIEIKKPESGNVELSGCRRILVLAKMSHESIC